MLSQWGLAQYSISGIIRDADTSSPLEYAEIYEINTGKFAPCTEEGKFTISDLPSGTYQLVLFSVEYNTDTTEVTIANGDITQDIYATKLSQLLSTVEIKARKQAIFAMRRLKPIEGTSIYAGKKSEVVQLDQIVGALASNTSRQIYAQVAGLNIYENNDAGLQLNVGGRGLDPNRTANFNTRQNGYDISADVLGYPESYYTPPAEALQEIQVVRGAASLQYGTQFGGLINFKMKEPDPFKKVSANIKQTLGSYGLNTTYAELSGTVDKFSYLTYYNRKSGDGYRDFSDYTSDNAYLYLGYKFTDKTELSGEVTYLDYLAQQAGGLTDGQFSEDSRQHTRERNWFDIDWLLYRLKLEHKFSEKATWDVSIFGLDARRSAVGYRGNPILLNSNPITDLDEQDAQGNYINPRDLLVGEFNNWGLESRYLHQYELGDKKAAILVGTKYYNASNTTLQGPGSNGRDADFTLANTEYPDYPNQSYFTFPNRNLALFGEHIFFLSDKLSITPGIRYEYIKTESEGQYQKVVFDNAGNPIDNQTLTDNNLLKRNLLLLGVGVSYKPSPSIEYYGNLSQNYRSVTFSDIRTVSPSFIIDPDIRDEKGWTFDLGSRGRIGKQFNYDVGLYSLLYDNRIGIILDDRANRVRKNIGTALIYGLEGYGEWNILKSINEDITDRKASIFLNTALTGSSYLQSEANNIKGKQVEFIPLANIKTGAKLGYRNFLASIQYSYVSEQYTDAENSPIAADGDSRSGIIGTIPAYDILDLSFSYQYRFITVDAGVLNLLDNTFFTRRATGYPGPGIIPSEGRSVYVTVGLHF